MNEAMQRSNELKKLELEIHSDLEAIRSLQGHIQQLVADNDSIPPYGNQLAIALCMHHIYTAMEQIFLRISKTIDLFTYQGEHWHKELLRNMTLEVPDTRPAIISKQLYPKIDNLRAFRHIVRHAYDYELDWSRLGPICLTIDGIIQKFDSEMLGFLTFISEIRQGLSN